MVIIKASNGNYYKLPGGGIEADEDHAEAAEREVAEETGCRVAVQGVGVATAEEYRNDLHQTSNCYRARLLDGAGEPALTPDEVADGLRHEWLPLDETLALMAAAEPTSQLGRYILARDVFLLTEATKSK